VVIEFEDLEFRFHWKATTSHGVSLTSTELVTKTRRYRLRSLVTTNYCLDQLDQGTKETDDSFILLCNAVRPELA
jgi:hypothetical protein